MRRILIIITDLAIIYSSIWMSFRLLDDNLLDFHYNLEAFGIIAPLIGVLYLILMYAYGLYNSARMKLGNLLYTVFLISISLMMGIMALCFFIRGGAMAFPRSVIFLSAMLYWLFLSVWRSLVWKAVSKNHGIKSITLVGNNMQHLISKLKTKYKHIYDIKFVCQENDPQLMSHLTDSDVVFITPDVNNLAREKILLHAAKHNQRIFFVPGHGELSLMSAALQRTDDIPTFKTSTMELTLEERFVKRLLDLILSIIGFLFFLPFGLITAILVKLDGGPIFYSQERLTRNGRIFKVLKFRTMVPDAEKLSGPVLAGADDPRITKMGKFMRATRLDEIPQILHILNGDMSIVGPRPERPFFTKMFEQDLPWYSQRLKVKAGLTGLAQVEGKYNTTVEDKLRYDLIYIHHYSLFQDLLIILQTIKILFIKDSTEGVEEKNLNVKEEKEENPNIKIEKSFY